MKKILRTSVCRSGSKCLQNSRGYTKLGWIPSRNYGLVSSLNTRSARSQKTNEGIVSTKSRNLARLYTTGLDTKEGVQVTSDAKSSNDVPDDMPAPMLTRLRNWVKECLDNPSAPKRLLRLSKQISITSVSCNEHGLGLRVQFGNSKGNSLNARLLEQLTATFDTLAEIEKVHTVVLTSQNGSSSAYCGGAAITELASIKSPQEARAFISRISALCTSIRNFPSPVIAAIDGACIGAGLEVVASCDIRVATKTSLFSMPEVRLGIPSVVEARLLCEIMGWGPARNLMLTGQELNATGARATGLVTMLHEERHAMLRWASGYIRHTSAENAKVYKQQKMLMRQWEGATIEAGIALSKETFASTFQDGINNVQENANKLKGVRRRKYEKDDKGIEAASSAELLVPEDPLA